MSMPNVPRCSCPQHPATAASSAYMLLCWGSSWGLWAPASAAPPPPPAVLHSPPSTCRSKNHAHCQWQNWILKSKDWCHSKKKNMANVLSSPSWTTAVGAFAYQNGRMLLCLKLQDTLSMDLLLSEYFKRWLTELCLNEDHLQHSLVILYITSSLLSLPIQCRLTKGFLHTFPPVSSFYMNFILIQVWPDCI